MNMNTDVNTDTHMTVEGDRLGRRRASVGVGVSGDGRDKNTLHTYMKLPKNK